MEEKLLPFSPNHNTFEIKFPSLRNQSLKKQYFHLIHTHKKATIILSFIHFKTIPIQKKAMRRQRLVKTHTHAQTYNISYTILALV